MIEEIQIWRNAYKSFVDSLDDSSIGATKFLPSAFPPNPTPGGKKIIEGEIHCGFLVWHQKPLL